MPSDPGALFTKFLRDHPAEILDMMGSNVEALTGQSVEIRTLDPGPDELGAKFSGRPVYVFPIADHASNPLNALLALDFSGAVHTGASFSLMGAEQVKEVMRSKEVPDILHDSIGEVANILCGAALDYVRENSDENPEFRRGDSFELIRPGPWPDILRRVGADVDWQVIGGQLLIEGEEKGCILLAAGEPAAEQTEQPEAGDAASTRQATSGPVSTSTPAAAAEGPEDKSSSGTSAEGPTPVSTHPDKAGDSPTTPSPTGPEEGTASTAGGDQQAALYGLRVALACHRADPNALKLQDQLAGLGVEIAWGGPETGGVHAAIVVSRSPTDLEARVRALAGSDDPPSLIIGSSDRPTRELVMAARRAGVGAFLVLPTGSSQLEDLLARVPARQMEA